MIQAIIGGIVSGATYAMIGVGIVLTYKVLRFINLAQGAYYVGAILLCAKLTESLPFILSALISIVVIGALSGVLYLTVFTHLARTSTASQLLGGVAMMFLLSGVFRLLFGTDTKSLPALATGGAVSVAGAKISVAALILLVALLVTCAFLWLVSRTTLGLRMESVAALSARAELIGVSVRRVAAFGFITSGVLAALAGIVVAPLTLTDYQSGLTITIFGFIAASFSGLRSVPGTVVGGLALGLFESIIAYQFTSSLNNAIALGVLVIVLIARSTRTVAGRHRSSAPTVDQPDKATTTVGPAAPLPSPVQVPNFTRVATQRGWPILALIVVAFAGPSVLPPYWVSIVSLIGVFIIIGVGLDLLLGYGGQLSLGQTAFAGVSAYLVALIPQWWGWTGWAAAAAAIVLTGGLALVLGFFVLRLSGHYFTLATLALSLGAESLIYGLPDQLGGYSGEIVSDTLDIGPLELSSPERLFTLTWVVVAVVVLVALRLARARFGKALQAVGTDERLAKSTGAPTFALKMQVFVLSAVLAGVAGVLYAHSILIVDPSTVGFEFGFTPLVGVMLGGFGTIWGAVIGITGVELLLQGGSVASGYQYLILGGALLIGVLFWPRGLVGTAQAALQRAHRGRTRTARGEDVDRTESWVLAEPTSELVPVLVAEDLARSFGGLRAVDGVSLAATPGRILGLIGPNGAGKSTCMSLLDGSLIPDRGRVRLSGRDVTGLRSHERARLGLARTFQLPLVPEGLTALDVASLGAYRRGKSGLLRGLLGRTDRERRQLQEAGYEALSLTGIAHLADEPADNLSTGHQKMLELARAVASAPSVLLADEPAGGLSAAEVDRLAEVLQNLAARGMAIVLVEHEMRLVMSICDEVLVVAQGGVLTHGAPAEVTRHQGVLDAYLGV